MSKKFLFSCYSVPEVFDFPGKFSPSVLLRYIFFWGACPSGFCVIFQVFIFFHLLPCCLINLVLLTLSYPTTTMNNKMKGAALPFKRNSNSRKRNAPSTTTNSVAPHNNNSSVNGTNGMDIQHLPLKPDHKKRPLWIFPYTARNYLDGVAKQNKQSSSSSSSSSTTSSSSKKKIKSNAGECRIIVET